MDQLAKQKGTALITAMVIMAITATIAYYLVVQQRTSVYRSQLIFNFDRAYHYANGATVWAESLLYNRLSTDEVVVIDDVLAPTELPVNDGVVSATLEDLQGKFNLNTLRYDDSLNQNLEQLRRLLSLVLIDTNQNQISIIMGSIAEHIAQMNPGQLPFVHISQLRMLDGINSEIYQQILPYVTVLPELTDININTVTAPVLQALLPQLSPSQITTLLEDRQNEPFASIDDVAIWLSSNNVEPDLDVITLQSQYFLLTTVVNIGEQQLVLYTTFGLLGEQGDLSVNISSKSIGTP